MAPGRRPIARPRNSQPEAAAENPAGSIVGPDDRFQLVLASRSQCPAIPRLNGRIEIFLFSTSREFKNLQASFASPSSPINLFVT